MSTENALSRLRDSLSQLGQMDFREQRSQTSAEELWTESPPPKPLRAASPHSAPRTFGSPNPRAISLMSPLTSVERLERPTVALTKALRSCQERCSQLEAKRSEVAEELRICDDDKARFQLALSRAEQENKQLLQERQKKMEETIHLRQELRIATEGLTDIEAQTKEKLSDHEAQRQRLERLVDEQRRHIETLESSNQRDKEEAHLSRDTIERLGRGMWAMLEEKTRSLEFMTNLVSSMQSLFYNPTPFLEHARRTKKCGGSHTLKRLELREGVSELRELLEQIEDEIADSSQAYSKFIQRLLQREDEMKRIIAVKPTSVLQQIQLADQLLIADAKAPSRDVDEDAYTFHPTSRKKGRTQDEQENAKALVPRRGKQSSLYVDWATEMEQFKAITTVMETKFSQLTKLKKVIQVKQPAARRAASSAQDRSHSVGRIYTSFC